MKDRIFLEPCPDSVWGRLPGGPEAWNDAFGECWQYLGTVVDDGATARHEFRHRAHPLYEDARVYADVLDDDAGPRLDRLRAVGRHLELPADLAGPSSDG